MANKPKIQTVPEPVAPVTPAPEAPPTVEQLQAQLAEAKAKLATANDKLVKAGVSEGMEVEVRQRVMLGLTREDAIICTRRQMLHDEALKLPNEKPEERQAREKAMITAGQTL